MTPRRAEDLPPPDEEEVPLQANVRRFPFIIGPGVVLEIALRHREPATEKRSRGTAAERPAPRPRPSP